METIFNNTFANGSSSGLTRYNACVGNNGKFYGKYFQGYDLSVKILCNSLVDDTTEIDQLIFPILFNARHAIELYLKDALYNIYEINKNLSPKKEIDINEDKLQSTHDLSILWQMFEDNSIKLDRRIKEFIDFQKEYVSDYFEIDLTGETFRYQYTKENAVHLAKTPLVNVVLFYKRYSVLSENMYKFNYFIEQIQTEYYNSPYTIMLSPNDLLQISKKLGNIDTWDEPSFDDIRATIKEEFSISSNELSRAVIKIKETPEYSRYIGLENYIFHISKERIIEVIKMLNESTDNYKEDYDNFNNFSIDEVLCINVFISGYVIKTEKEYLNIFKSLKNSTSKEEAICEIISKVKHLTLKRIRNVLENFGIVNLS